MSENYFGDGFNDDERWEIAELSALIETIDRQQEGLERIAHDDPCGAVFFAEDDGWWDLRLSGKPRK